MYCLSCKATTKTVDLHHKTTANGRSVASGKCGKCGRAKTRFLSGAAAASLGHKRPAPAPKRVPAGRRPRARPGAIPKAKAPKATISKQSAGGFPGSFGKPRNFTRKPEPGVPGANGFQSTRPSSNFTHYREGANTAARGPTMRPGYARGPGSLSGAPRTRHVPGSH